MSNSTYFNRRALFQGMAVIAAGGAGGAFAANRLGRPDLVLEASPKTFGLMEGKTTLGMMGYGSDGPPPVIRMPRDTPFSIDLVNDLDEATTVHWHGLRVANAQDGVPYLTQPPVAPGARYRYTLNSPDAGTFWYHPHCNTLDQMARGLNGVLIVEDDEPLAVDADIPLLLRDFRLGGDGQFIDFFEPRKAARGGTLGTVTTVNWQTDPVIDVPAGGIARLRFAVSDVTRVYSLAFGGTKTRVIALDGQPVTQPVVSEGLLLAPGQRADILVQMPEREGEIATVSRSSPSGQMPLVRLRSKGASLKRALAEIPALAPNPVAVPDLTNAEVQEFVFGWSPGGDAPQPGICGTLGYTFWSINRVAWPGDLPTAGAPLATLRHGRSYILRLRNETPNDHPIHLHGMTFRLLRSDKRELPQLWTDTALLRSQETIDVALVADNLGDWAFHCHVIEHQKTGLTGYIRVEG